MNPITNPIVTVLMAVYNGGKYLKSSVKSVLNQRFRDFEFLIINDCSTDDFVKVVESFNDSRIVIHNNVKNMGQTKSLNVGLTLAKGEYIARMDADDMAFPMWLEKLLSFIKDHPGYAAVSCSAAVIDGSGAPKRIHRTPTNLQDIMVNLFFGKAMNHVGAILNKKTILENGGYDESFSTAQDYELWSSLIRNNCRIINIPDVLVSVRVHESSHGFIEAEKKGLMETAETIARTVRSLAKLDMSHEEAIKMRLFYRFPSQLTIEDFRWVQRMYETIFEKIKQNGQLDPKLLKKSLRRQMLRPFCLRAVHEVEMNRPRVAREINRDYIKLYGFHMMPFFLYLISFAGFKVSKGLPSIYEKWLETVTALYLRIKSI